MSGSTTVIVVVLAAICAMFFIGLVFMFVKLRKQGGSGLDKGDNGRAQAFMNPTYERTVYEAQNTSIHGMAHTNPDVTYDVASATKPSGLYDTVTVQENESGYLDVPADDTLEV